MTKKKKKELLRAQLLCALILGGNAMLGGAVADAEADYVSGDYNEDITSTAGIGVAGGNTVNINGNLKVTTSPMYGLYVLSVYGTDGTAGILRVNQGKNKTVQIEGNLDNSLGNAGEIYVNFSNSDSYLAGNVDNVEVIYSNKALLAFSNGATWYVSGDSSVEAITAAGGNLDFWHTKPATTRGDAAGAGGCTLSNVGDHLNGATFIISSDIQNDKADHVTLSNVSGSNTYTIKVAYDPAKDIGDGTYTATTAPVVLTTSNSDNTVQPGSYTATRTEDAGLTTERQAYADT